MQPTDSKNSTILDTSQQPNETQTITIPPSKKKSKPSSKTRRRLKDAEPLPFNIDGLSHDGRGVAVYGNGFGEADGHIEDKHGKKIFVSFALPGESALVKITNSRTSFEEGDAVSITANPTLSALYHPARILASAVAVICNIGSQRVK